MADAAETMRYLVRSYDIAPAGTQEEGQAAKSLSEVFHEHGLETVNKSFRYSSLGDVPYAVAAVVVGLAAALSGLGGAVSVVMLVIGAVFAALYFADVYLDIRTLSRFGASGSSQNVVARHPAAAPSSGQKARTVVVIAHYDTPRADIFALPLLAPLQPYLRSGVAVCMAAGVVCALLQVLPLPVMLHSLAWAVSIVAGAGLVVWGACVALQRFVMPYTSGANDNKASVAALFGLLDRVRPLRVQGPNEALYEAMESEEGPLVDEERPRGRARDARPRSDERARARRDEGAREAGRPPLRGASAQEEPEQRGERPVRYGEATLRSLGILPPSCQIVYDSGRVHRVDQATSAGGGAPEGDVTVVIAPEDRPAALSGDAPADAAAPAAGQDAAVEEEPTGEAAIDAAADAIMADIVGSGSLSGSEAREPDAAPGRPAAAEATSLLAPVAAQPAPEGRPASAQRQPQPQQQAQAASARPFRVITSSDEVDAEVHEAQAAVPPDIAAQSSKAASGFFSDDDPSSSIVNDPTWGTSSFRPVTASSAGRRILNDIPDPAVAAVDPFSVSSIDPVGGYNPDDFSAMDFATGTHQAVTPNMLDHERRRALDGFSDIAEAPKKSARKAKKGSRQGRISRQAAQMQAEMEEGSFNDWLGLEEGYDAKKNGREIGSWDNFENDGANGTSGSQDGTGDDGRGTRWQGGAARARTRSPRREPDDGGRAERRAAMTLGDRELIAHEIWFVLTGASEEGHAGVEDFLHTYREELHGAYFINLECVGAGRQSLVLEEGVGRRSKAERRIVNLFGDASAAINRPLALTRMRWRDTEATAALRHGCRAVTVTGIDRGAQANARWTGDTPEKVNPEQIDDLVDVIVEVIKNA